MSKIYYILTENWYAEHRIGTKTTLHKKKHIRCTDDSEEIRILLGKDIFIEIPSQNIKTTLSLKVKSLSESTLKNILTSESTFIFIEDLVEPEVLKEIKKELKLIDISKFNFYYRIDKVVIKGGKE